MTAHGLLERDEGPGAADLVLDGLGAETADPPPAMPLPYAGDVRRRALLHEPAAVARRELHLHRRGVSPVYHRRRHDRERI